MDAYTGFAAVYDLFMDDVPYGEWADRIIGILKKYGIEDGLVLDLGCGTGSMTGLLSAAGYDMIGVDSSEEMLEIADAKKMECGAADILYLCQDMREFELYGTVRAVVSVCDALNYITDAEDLLQVFRLVHNYLDEDGVFIFDMNTVYKYTELLGGGTFAENRDEGSFIWENYFDPGTGINEYDITIYMDGGDGRYSRFEETHYQRAYESAKVAELLLAAGFPYMEMVDSDTGGEPADDTERILFTARKKEGNV